MKPIHKLNNGNGATLCNNCHGIINIGMTDTLLCNKCVGYLDLKEPDAVTVRFFNRYKDLQEFKLLPENNILWTGNFVYCSITELEVGLAVDPSGGPFIGPDSDMGYFSKLFKGLIVEEIVPYDGNYLIITRKK